MRLTEVTDKTGARASCQGPLTLEHDIEVFPREYIMY